MFGFFKTPWTCRREMLFPLGPRMPCYKLSSRGPVFTHRTTQVQIKLDLASNFSLLIASAIALIWTMAFHSLRYNVFCFSILFSLLIALASAELSSDFYASTCPNALSTIKSAVKSAVAKEHRMGASLLRLHFHDCFVNVRSFFSNSSFICFTLTHAWSARMHIHTRMT